MTILQAKPPASPTPPSPKTTRARRRASLSGALRLTEVPVWAVARAVVRRPWASTALTAAVTATTPVTLREVTGVVVGGCLAIGCRSFWMSGSQMSEPSLQEIAKFRKRDRLVRRRWVTVMADCGMAKAAVDGRIDKRRPAIRRVTREPHGVAVLVDGSRVSAGVAAFLSVADKLRAGFRCISVKIQPQDHNVLVRLRYEHPFRRPVRLAELPAPARYGHVVVGIDEDGGPVEKDLRLPHLLVGAPGSGKSSETITILRAIIDTRIPLRLRIFDPKGGQEFDEFDGAAYEYVRDPTKWPLFLEHSLRAMAGKQAALRAAGMRKVDRYSLEFPLDVMVIDELLTAVTFGAGKKVKVNGTQVSAEDAFMTYLSTARSAGCTVLASTQLAQKEVLGKVRGLFGYVTCLRVAPTERELVDILLGSGASKAYPAHELPQDERFAGIGYTVLPRGVTKYRAAYLTDRERAQVVRGVDQWTRQLGRDGDES